MPAGAPGSAGLQPRAWSEAIRAHMGRQRLSGKALAAKHGVSQNYLATRLRDEAPFNINDLEQLAAALAVLVIDLVRESGVIAARMQQVHATPDQPVPKFTRERKVTLRGKSTRNADLREVPATCVPPTARRKPASTKIARWETMGPGDTRRLSTDP